jgi:hypothetical protein
MYGEFHRRYISAELFVVAIEIVVTDRKLSLELCLTVPLGVLG